LPALRAQVIPVKFLYQHEHPVPERELEAGDIPIMAGERGIGPLRLKFMFHAGSIKTVFGTANNPRLRTLEVLRDRAR
jgi:hypothetical protein